MVLLQVSQSLQLRNPQQLRQFQFTYIVTIAVATSGGGSITLTDQTTGEYGTATSTTINLPLEQGDALSILANPATGYQFDHFAIVGPTPAESGNTTENPFTTGLGSNFTIAAYFVPATGVNNQTLLIIGGVGVAAVIIGAIAVASSKLSKGGKNT
jgi:hypothetical protein